jgi:hypothetical protein
MPSRPTPSWSASVRRGPAVGTFGRLAACGRESTGTRPSFVSIADAKAKIETLRLDYDQRRPHSSLRDLTPNEFVARSQGLPVVETIAVSR